MSGPGAAPAGDQGGPAAPPPRRVRRGRWLWRIAAVVLLLALIAIVAVQVTLGTDLPRRILVSKLEEELGLRVAARSLSTGWRGHTALENVTLALPLADDAFLEMPELEVQHTMLPLMLLGRKVEVQKIVLRRPRLLVRQDAMGRWNVEEALSLMTPAGGGQQAGREQPPGDAPSLPEVSITDGTLLLIDNEGRSASLSPFTLHGRPDSALAWEFEAAVASQLQAVGRVAPRQNWSHRVSFTLQRLGEVIAPWLAETPEPMGAAGEWAGQVKDDVLSGRLNLTSAVVEGLELSGSARVRAGGGSAAVRPELLMVKMGNTLPTPIRVTGGGLELQGTQLTIETMQLGLLGGSAHLEGMFDSQSLTGRFSAEWIEIAWPADFIHRGGLSASVDRVFGRPRVAAELRSSGTAPEGAWAAEMTVSADGRSWQSMAGHVAVPQLVWTGKPEDISFSNLLAAVSTEGPILRVADLRLGETQQLSGGGHFNFDSRDWGLALDARELPLPNVPTPVTISLQASGTPRRIDVASASVTSEHYQASARGHYELPDPREPDNPGRLSAEVAFGRQAFAFEDPRRGAIGGGALRGRATASGTVNPLSVGVEAQVTGRNVFFGNRQLGDVSVQLEGDVNDQRIRLVSKEDLELLEGQWALEAQYNLQRGSASAAIDVRNLSLKQADALIDPPPDARGMLAAELRLSLPHPALEALAVEGDWSVQDLQKDFFAAEHAAGNLRLNNGILVLGDVHLRQGDGLARAELRYHLRPGLSDDAGDSAHLSIAARFEEWPIESPERELLLAISGDTGPAGLKLNLDPRLSITGPVNLSAAVQLHGQEIGAIAAGAMLAGREIELSRLDAQLVGGTLEGHARIVFDDLMQSTAQMTWRDLPADRLAEMFPGLDGITGHISGQLIASKPIDPHVEEPLRIQFDLTPAEMSYRGMSIGRSHIIALLGPMSAKQIGTASPAGADAVAPAGMLPDRIVIDRASTLRLAGGAATVWGRASSRGGERFGWLHAQVNFSDLDLNQLVHAVEPEAEPMIGKVSGEMTVFGPRYDYTLMNGQVYLRLSDSDLANSDIFAPFYRLFTPERGPSGVGAGQFSLQDGRLRLRELLYRKSGLEVRASGEVENVFEGVQSPISGYALGSARPLRDVKLPGLPEIDDVLNALQATATTFRISGTIHEPKLQQATLSEIGSDLRKMLLGEVKEERRGR